MVHMMDERRTEVSCSLTAHLSSICKPYISSPSGGTIISFRLRDGGGTISTVENILISQTASKVIALVLSVCFLRQRHFDCYGHSQLVPALMVWLYAVGRPSKLLLIRSIESGFLFLFSLSPFQFLSLFQHHSFHAYKQFEAYQVIPFWKYLFPHRYTRALIPILHHFLSDLSPRWRILPMSVRIDTACRLRF
jgi:hypothetical protein